MSNAPRAHDDVQGDRAHHAFLVYTTDPFPDGVEVTGTIGITLYVSSDAVP